MTALALEHPPEIAALPVVGRGSPDNRLYCHRWLLIEADGPREVTVSPPMTLAEVQRIFPGSSVRMDDRQPDPPADRDVELAIAWGLLMAERDAALLGPLATEDGLAWLQDCGMRDFLAAPDALITSLADAEAIAVASAIVDQVELPASLRRVLATIAPPMQGAYGSERNRAKHARSVLRLVAADPTIRDRFLTGVHSSVQGAAR